MERMFKILMAPEGMDGGAGGGGTGDGAGGDGGAGEGSAGAGAGAGGGEGGAGGGAPQTIPYARFQEVNGKYRELESKYGQMQTVLDQMKNALSPEQKRGFKLDYNNPDKSIEEHFNKLLDERMNGLKQESTQREQQVQRQAAIKWFQSQEDYSPELEEKAARFITENGLQGLDPEKAIKLAHKFVTLGDGSGYVRQQKESMRKPGGGGKDKSADLNAQLAALDPKDPDYDKKMKEIHSKLVGG